MHDTSSEPNQAVERYRALPDLSRFPIGNNLELVYCPRTQVARTLPAESVRLLWGCPTFGTLAEHAGRLCRELNLGPRQEAVQQQLTALAAAGLLSAHGDLAGSFQAKPSPPCRITSVGVPTRNRTASLERCLDSYLASAGRHERRPGFVVVDDSSGEAVRANRELVEGLRARHQMEITWAGRAERLAFTEILARRAAVPPEVVRFGLLGDERYPITTGASRNALLLWTAGEALLQVDDDTVCRLSRAPGHAEGLALSSRPDPTELWFLAAGEAADEGLAEGDLLAIHEQLLGKGPEGWLAEHPGARLDVEEAGPGFFRGANVRARATMAGWTGGSGMGFSSYFLSLEGPSRARLLRSEAVYRHALASHQLTRAVRRATLGEGNFCMALNLGLDNRELLPPFLPVQRGQDAVFGALLRSCFDGHVGYLPWVLLHQPGPRQVSAEHLARGIARATTGQVIQLLLRSFAPGPDRRDGARNLRILGRALAEWGLAEAGAFAELVRGLLWGQMSRLALLWEGQLRRYGGQPAFWADDVRRLLDVLRGALPGKDFGTPADLEETFGEEVSGRLQELVGKFGALLEAWPELVTAARELKDGGQALTGRG